MADDEILQAVKGFLDRDYPGERRLAALRAHGEDPRLLEEAARQGWFGLVAPEAEDGLGLDPARLVPLLRLLGQRLVPGPLMEQMLLPGLLLRTAPGDSARSRLASALIGGARVAVLDPGVTLDWRAANGSPVLGSGGLAGSVDLVRFGAVSDLFVVIVDGTDAKATVLVVDRARSGITVTGHESTDPGASYAGVSLDAVAVEQGDIIAQGEDGAALVALLRSWQRVLVAAELAGIARHMLDASVEFAKQREQFGRPIGSFQAIKHIAASAAQRVIMLESFVEAVAADSAALAPKEFALAALTLKAHAAGVGRSVCEDALQIHGGIGFTHEHELHWYYKRALSLRTWYGDEREAATEAGRRMVSA
ncbi:acyl-CoA dehydrogenase family protein [Streptomyces sp. NPDC005774]|uniref:acyl-CoA dehydrogenase family protein n=1 Tax=Streptomyces sp. NPDC005774 TaxID=3364728 RepID=UPI003690A9C1